MTKKLCSLARARSRFWSLTALLVLLTSPLAFAAEDRGAIVGKVTPPHDHGFTLTTARIPELGLKVDVAADGTFRFDAVRPGTWVVEVRVPSLGVAVEAVEVRPGEETPVEVVLTPGSHFEEIVVTAADSRDPLDLAAPITSLSGEELALRVESSLGETLAREPGISSTFFGPGASRPIIRGLAGDRVRVLEGGIGTGDASAVSADHAVASDPAQAERIEVLRGPATLLYGSSAIGGAVNIIDERIPTTRASRAVSGSVEARGGSVADERAGSLELHGGSGNWAWHVGAGATASDDYEIPGFARLASDGHDDGPFGSVPNSDLETTSGRFGMSYFFGDVGFFGGAISNYETEYGLPVGGESDHEEGPVRIDLEQRRIDLQAEMKRDFGPFQAARARFASTDYEHAELAGDEVGTRFFNDFYEARLELVQKPRGRQSGSLGLQVSSRDFQAVGEEAFLPATATDRWAVFAFQELVAGPLRWQLGGRYESQDIDPTGFAARSHDGVSASLGLVWDIDDRWSLATSLARSVKLPAAEELYADGLHVATQAYELGDPELGEESSLGLDVSLRLETDRFSGELTLFHQDFDDFIFQAFTGAEEEGFPVVLYSQEDARFAGAELKGRVELFERDGHHLHLRLMGDIVDAELKSGGNLPRIPPLRLGAGLHYHSEHWNASSDVMWVDDQTAVAVNETPTAGYTLVEANLGRRFLFREQIVDVLLRGRNLGDEEARSHTSFLKNVAPLPGRDVSLSVKLLF